MDVVVVNLLYILIKYGSIFK